MSDSEFLLGSGRAVRLVRFYLDHTYAGVLEGNSVVATPYILGRLHEDVSRILPPGRPLVIIKPDAAALPAYRLIAHFESARGARTHDPDWGSRLFACWFVDELDDASIGDLARSTLPALDWDAQAADFDRTLL